MKIRSINARKYHVQDIIPPRSIVMIIKADEMTPSWKNKIGTRFRIGYYNSKDGLDTIWLVDDKGNYVETTDRKFLMKYFKIIKLTTTKNYFGYGCKPLTSIKGHRQL
ncbi:MAG: hypothetical protein HY896_07910 [Deltaproteobacteria bacterium]|nr:hypothetical protein [Deltaproteobacteria bacterium]